MLLNSNVYEMKIILKFKNKNTCKLCFKRIVVMFIFDLTSPSNKPKFSQMPERLKKKNSIHNYKLYDFLFLGNYNLPKNGIFLPCTSFNIFNLNRVCYRPPQYPTYHEDITSVGYHCGKIRRYFTCGCLVSNYPCNSAALFYKQT